MRIIVLQATSRAALNRTLYDAVCAAAPGHTVLDLGCFPEETEVYSYIEIAVEVALLLGTGAADFVVTGCSSGQGMMLACNALPGVVCGYLPTPQDAYLFAQINNGNAASLPLGLGYGWAGELNLRYTLKALFEQSFGNGYPAGDAERKKRDTLALKRLKANCSIPLRELPDRIDPELLRRALSRPCVIDAIRRYATDRTLLQYIDPTEGREWIMEHSYQDINAATIDRWVRDGWEWGRPLTHEQCEAIRRGEWDVVLTPVKPVPHEWLGDLRNRRVLGLACGGGQQVPTFALLGAQATVLDYSQCQLENDRLVAEREGLDIEIVRADMTKPLPFPDESFDLIFHPVSNSYIADVQHVWNECYRILKHGGVLLAGLENGLNYAYDADETALTCVLPFDPLHNEAHRRILEAEDAGMQFSHTIEEQIGGQLKAGLRLTDLYGDTNGTGLLHSFNIPTYNATRSVKD